jgi:hypothetical protein
VCGVPEWPPVAWCVTTSKLVVWCCRRAPAAWWVQGFRPGTVVITGADPNPGRKIVALRLLRSTWAGFTSGGSPLHRPGEEGLGGDSGFSGPSQSLYVLASPRGSQAPEPINFSTSSTQAAAEGCLHFGKVASARLYGGAVRWDR